MQVTQILEQQALARAAPPDFPVNVREMLIHLDAIDPSCDFFHLARIARGKPVKFVDISRPDVVATVKRWQADGCSVGVVINETYGNARERVEIVNARAYWHDGTGERSFPLPPSIETETQPNVFHRCFVGQFGYQGIDRIEWAEVMARMVQAHGSDAANAKPEGVALLAGTWNFGALVPFKVRTISQPADDPYALPALHEAFPRKRNWDRRTSPGAGVADRVKRIGVSKADASDVPHKRWIVEGFLERGETTILVAPGGTGKSQFTLLAAVAIARGDGRALGLDVFDHGPILIINAEDGENDMLRRLLAIDLTHGTDHSELPLHFYDGDGRRFVAAVKAGSKIITESADYKELLSICRELKPALLIVDPLSKWHEGVENDNGDMTRVTDFANQLARQADMAVLLVHHTSKPSKAAATGQEGDANSSRGASAIVNGVRIARTLQVMDKATAKRLGVAEADQPSYVRLDDAKANHSKKKADPAWFKMVSVRLPNGEDAPALTPATLAPANEAEIKARVLSAIAEAAANGTPITVYLAGVRKRLPELVRATEGETDHAIRALQFQGLIVKAERKKDGKSRACWVPTEPAKVTTY